MVNIQPWSFSISLMIGFTAEFAGGAIKIKKEELEDAPVFRRRDAQIGFRAD